MTTFTTEDRDNASYHPDGFAPMVAKTLRPMGFTDIQQLFDISLGDEGIHAKLADLIELVRKVEKYHGIG